MSLDNLDEARYENGSPLQLLIFLTVSATTFLCLFVADALEWPAITSIFIAASVFTSLRIMKKLLTVFTQYNREEIKSRINPTRSVKLFGNFIEVYFTMFLLSLFCYGVGVALHIIYHLIF
ncbi:hypothetical protein KO525_03165 [Psychrosphaera sp. B3R10]|uniref:Uncharacterized protein n=1 Tax=Psychrosphaera algicola TaxID=3023714 RepID=A0ABT5F9A3_9GAMM|nr:MULTISPECIES: hypothetical protein [unclassified Psychrosphaera]MBU2881275.1 hypothetical protein [Psychrosphaera sp. I2R16]MBU2988374.1 hypothetical protein [Psychrosphaera sp. B3R10]MDC2888104.1 hypothetical protein [Psychrosphaera sp. G1-22]MDO6720126.1 hypothetical protein [Psychrosphaera sp. 1_MG-2023]